MSSMSYLKNLISAIAGRSPSPSSTSPSTSGIVLHTLNGQTLIPFPSQEDSARNFLAALHAINVGDGMIRVSATAYIPTRHVTGVETYRVEEVVLEKVRLEGEKEVAREAGKTPLQPRQRPPAPLPVVSADDEGEGDDEGDDDDEG